MMIGSHDLVQNLPATARALGLASLQVRREDLNGIGIGGTKSRTMQRALAAAARRGASILVLPARAGSNAVVAACVLAKGSDLKLHAVLRPQPGSQAACRNLGLIHASGCAISPVGLDVSLRRNGPFLNRLAERLQQAGERAEFLSFGAATIEAGLAHFSAFMDLAAQFRLAGTPRPDRIYMAAASFDSGAGVLAGIATAGWPTTLVLVNVAQDAVPSPACVLGRAQQVLQLTGTSGPAGPANVPARLLQLRDQLAPGFGQIDPAALDQLTALGLPFALDPSYTAKAALALLDDARQGAVRQPMLWYGSPDTAQLDVAARNCAVPSGLADALLL